MRTRADTTRRWSSSTAPRSTRFRMRTSPRARTVRRPDALAAANPESAAATKKGAGDEQQRANATRPVSEHAAQGTRAGVDLPRQRHQAARPDRVVRPVRRAAQEHRHANGLQARDLDGRSLASRGDAAPVSYTHLRAHETGRNLVC